MNNFQSVGTTAFPMVAFIVVTECIWLLPCRHKLAIQALESVRAVPCRVLSGGICGWTCICMSPVTLGVCVTLDFPWYLASQFALWSLAACLIVHCTDMLWLAIDPTPASSCGPSVLIKLVVLGVFRRPGWWSVALFLNYILKHCCPLGNLEFTPRPGNSWE